MGKQTKVRTSHQVGSPVKKRGKSGKLGKITAVVGKAKYKVQWAGDDTASDTEYANTSLLVVDPPAAPDVAVGADGPAGAECDSDGGSDDDGDQFEAARRPGMLRAAPVDVP